MIVIKRPQNRINSSTEPFTWNVAPSWNGHWHWPTCRLRIFRTKTAELRDAGKHKHMCRVRAWSHKRESKWFSISTRDKNETAVGPTCLYLSFNVFVIPWYTWGQVNGKRTTQDTCTWYCTVTFWIIQRNRKMISSTKETILLNAKEGGGGGKEEDSVFRLHRSLQTQRACLDVGWETGIYTSEDYIREVGGECGTLNKIFVFFFFPPTRQV